MKINTTFTSERVPTRTKWLYPLSGIGRDMAYTLVSLFLMTFIQYTMDPVDYDKKMLAFTIFLVLYRVWDGVNDPIMGTIIENSHFKMGKYKPWILIGALTNAVFLVLLFNITLSGWWYVAVIGIVYFFWEVSFTMNDIAYWSLLPSLTSESKQRGQITTLVSVFAAIGAFISGGLIPFLSGKVGLIDLYHYFSIVVAVIFLICQLVLVFFTQERERSSYDPEEGKQSLLDMFRIIWRNKQLWVMMISVTLYYLGSALLNAFGLNYFYFAYGFETGGTNMTLFTVVYALSTVLSQMSFPLIQRHMKQKTILFLSFITMVIGYAAFLVLGLLPALTNAQPNLWLLMFVGFFIFAGQGVFYMALLIMMTNTIEYNEWTTGKRSESIIFAARPFAAKVSSSLQTLLVYLVLLIGGVYGVSQQISQIQIDGYRNGWAQSEIVSQSTALITNSPNRSSGTIAILLGMTIIPIILYLIAYIYMRHSYKINEENYKQMMKDISEGKISSENHL